MRKSTYVITTIVATLVLLIAFGSINYYIDPLFHFHAPQEGIEYPLWSERYMNDGITRNFDYDAVITGTSMTENFNASQFDGYFGTQSIKVPFSGGTYREIGDVLRRCFDRNPNIRYVLRSLDTAGLIADKDSFDYEDYPDYLYDNNIFNDTEYLLSKDLYLEFTEYVFEYNRQGGITTNFDTYKNWAGLYDYNVDSLIENYERFETASPIVGLTDEDRIMLTENLEQNVISLVKEHPETQFYLFDPPYSLIFFDQSYGRGEINRYIDAWEVEADLLLQYDNVHFFSFYDDFETVVNLGNYRDSIHYNQAVTNHIIDCMATGEHQLTKDNKDAYFTLIRTYYNGLNYDELFGEGGVYGKK